MCPYKTLILSLLFLCTANLAAQPIGKTLPEFQFQDLSGHTTSLEELRKTAPNGILMLTFWCTDCQSCRTGEKHLAELIKEFDGKAKIVAISSSRQDNSEHVATYLKKNKLKLPVIMDPTSALGRHFGVTRTTTTLVLDKDGRLRYYGTLLKQKRLYARESLAAVIKGGIVGQPVGPIFG